MGVFKYSSADIRSNVEKAFSVVCNNELVKFDSLCNIVNRINNFCILF